MNIYLRILTNFENNDGTPALTVEDLGQLYDVIRDCNCNWVTITSLTGDPLYNFGKNLKWWSTMIFDIVPHYTRFELHTSYISVCSNDRFCGIFERIVYHCASFKDVQKIRRCGNQTVQVAFDIDSPDIDKVRAYIEDSPFIDDLWTDDDIHRVYYVYNTIIRGRKISNYSDIRSHLYF